MIVEHLAKLCFLLLLLFLASELYFFLDQKLTLLSKSLSHQIQIKQILFSFLDQKDCAKEYMKVVGFQSPITHNSTGKQRWYTWRSTLKLIISLFLKQIKTKQKKQNTDTSKTDMHYKAEPPTNYLPRKRYILLIVKSYNPN